MERSGEITGFMISPLLFPYLLYMYRKFKNSMQKSRLQPAENANKSDVSVYFMRTKATSADIHSLDLSVYQYANSLDIRFPGSLCFQMGMGYVESRSGFLAANFTIVSHVLHLLALPQLQHS